MVRGAPSPRCDRARRSRWAPLRPPARTPPRPRSTNSSPRRLGRPDDRVPALAGVGAGVAVGRGVAAAHVAAGQAGPQVDPAASRLQAVLTALDGLGRLDADLVEVGAGGHGHEDDRRTSAAAAAVVGACGGRSHSCWWRLPPGSSACGSPEAGGGAADSPDGHPVRARPARGPRARRGRGRAGGTRGRPAPRAGQVRSRACTWSGGRLVYVGFTPRASYAYALDPARPGGARETDWAPPTR